MKALVCGGAGYIGSHTQYQLIRDGHEVIVLDNLSTGFKAFIHEKAKFYYGDIRIKEDIDKVFKAEKDIDVVMHFAGKIVVPESVVNPLDYYYNNVEGLRTLLSAMVDNNCLNIVFSSSAAVYGEPKTGICVETDETKPINPYGETKLIGENLIKYAAAAHNLKYCIFRYFNVAGADDSLKIGYIRDKATHLVPAAILSALGLAKELTIFGKDYDTKDGTCVRDYIHVVDLADAHVLGAKFLMTKKESAIINLGSSEGFTVKEVIDEVGNIVPIKYQYGSRRPGDPAKLIASNEKAKEILKWEPKRTLEDMIKSEIAFRKEQAK